MKRVEGMCRRGSDPVQAQPTLRQSFDPAIRALLLGLCLVVGAFTQVQGQPSTPALSFVNIGQNPSGSMINNGGGSYNIIGGGNDVWDNMDECTFAYTEVSGDFDVKVRVASLQANAFWSKAGLMLRESLAEDSRMAFPRVTPQNGANDVRFAYRTGQFEPEGPDNAHNGGRHEEGFDFPNYPFAWLRLERLGNLIQGYSSFDGVNWSLLGWQDTATWEDGPLKRTVLVGLAASRHSGGLTAAAEFRDFHLAQPRFDVGDASSRGNPNRVRVAFTHQVGFGADNPNNYFLWDGISSVPIANALPGPTPNTVTLQTSATLVEGRTYTLNVSGVSDDQGIPLEGSGQASFVHGAGYEQGYIRIARNMSGPQVGTYLDSTAYRRQLPVRSVGIPAVTTSTLFEDNTPNDSIHENFSVNAACLVRVTTAGNYRFAIAADDKAILYLSTDDNPANKREIAREPQWANPRAFASLDRRNPTNPENQSAPIFLTPGNNYYLEFVCAEDAFGNHASVAWDAGTGAAFFDGQTPLQTSAMALGRMHQGTVFYNLGLVSITRQPTGQVATAGGRATFTVKVDGTPPYTFQWLRNNISIPGATSQSYVTPPLSPSDNGASYRVRVSNEFTTPPRLSLAAFVSVNQETTPPSLVSVGTLDGQTIGVCFSERVTPAAAQDISRYFIEGGTVFADNATLRPDGKSVILNVSGFDPPPGYFFDLQVFGMEDYSGNFGDGLVFGSTLGMQGVGIAENPPGSSFTCDGNQIEIVAGGADVWDAADQCHFVSKTVAGDFDVKVRVQDLARTHFWSKAGLMARESLVTDSRTIQIYTTPRTGANEIESTMRPETGAYMVAFGPQPWPAATFPNNWLRLVRAGDTFTAYRGTDGVNWLLSGQASVPGFPPVLNVGLFATSHDPTATTTAQFSDLQFVTQGPVITAQPQDVTLSDCGGAATFSVEATSGEPLSYQWQFNGVDLPGEINSVLTIPNVGLNNQGDYRVIVSNSSGSQPSQLARLTVNDMTPPIISSLPPPRNVPAAANDCQASIPNLAGEVIANDMCSAVTIAQSPPAGTVVGLGPQQIMFDVADAAGNTVTAFGIVIVEDVTPPQTACLDPPAQFDRGGPGNNAMQPANPSPALSLATGVLAPTFYNNNSPTAQFTETIVDLPDCLTEAVCTIGVIVTAENPSTTIVLATAVGADLNAHWTGYVGQPGPSGEPPLIPGPLVPGMTAQITLNLGRLPVAHGQTVDLIPNFAERRFIDVYINQGVAVDFIGVNINSCRSYEDILVNNDPGQAGAAVEFAMPPFTDNCVPNPSVSASHAPGSFFPIGQTTVAVSATDGRNVGRTWFKVICRDMEPPTLQCRDMLIECVKPSGAPVFYDPGARDNSGNVTAQCAPPSGSVFRLGTTPVICHAFDSAGNSAQCTFRVTLTGRIPPPIRTVRFEANNFTITFETQAGQEYVVEYKDNMADLYWSELTRVDGTGGLVTVTDPLTGQPSRFYRVALVADPMLPAGAISIFEPPEPPPAQPGPSDPCRPGLCGPPNVYLFSGEFHYETVDLCIKGRGLDFVWARKYRSCVCWLTPMGYGWDYSYNICIVPNGENIDVLDGNTRQDTFMRRPDGSFAADQFFREGRFEPNGQFVLTFADRGKWIFQPLDSGMTQGRIVRIEDRNGNALRFTYDGFGRLTNVMDTLDRNIVVSYDNDGFISAITDFTGRQVRYTHYQDADADGSFGDLRSAVSPVVLGTPNGNNFPGGKTNTYTYSKGNEDMRLNHNLLTITDGKRQSWLQNTYAVQPDFGCAVVVRQVWGYPNETLNYFYQPQTPAPANNFSIVKAIVNDRVGNVTECYFDAGNRCVINRAFTGRAIAGQRTTDTQNRPSAKLRSADPDFFQTGWDWNVDSMPTRITYPNGNRTENIYQFELDPASSRRSRGNLRICRKLPGSLGGDQTALVESFEYEAGAGGGCCDFNFVSKHTDARGNVTLPLYDGRGNRLHTQHPVPAAAEDFDYNAYGQRTLHVLPDNGTGHRRRDIFSYYGEGWQRGYLAQQIVDAGTLALTSTFEYDAVGNVIRTVAPEGNDTHYVVNALNQVVREFSREVTPGTGLRYQRDFYYDANNNLVRVDVDNRDDQGVLQNNARQSTIFDFEILNHVSRAAQEKGDAHPLNGVLNYEAIPFALRPQFVATEYRYDANRNRTLVRYGEAAAGFDVFNTVASSYDERDLLFRETRAPGSALQSTTQHDYDGNQNLTRTSQGLEVSPDAPAAPRITVYAFDGFNRQVAVTDAMGNVTTYRYDANGNCARVRVDGELTDLNGGSGNRRLAEALFQYDEMDRQVREDKAFFDPRTQAAIDDGFGTTLTRYNGNSQVIGITDDRGNSTATIYDTANRRATSLDAKMNSTTYVYDPGGNVIATMETERSDLNGSAQTFTTVNQYDGLDRLIQRVGSGNDTNRYTYDSRNNRASHLDPRGNVARYEYDGLNRLIETRRAFTDTGDGSGTVTRWLTTKQAWDDSCRLIAQTDDNGRTTRYAYDSLNRRIVTRMADGTMHLVGSGTVNWPEGQDRPVLNEQFSNGHDVHDNQVMTTDANRTVVTTTFDLLNRPVNKSIARAANVLGTIFESRQFNGLSLVMLARNNDSLVTRAYDSLCQPLREALNFDAPAFAPAMDHVTVWTWDGAGNQLSCRYPGGRLITRAYDALNRLQDVNEAGAPIAELLYIGPRRLEALCYRNGTCAEFDYDAGRLAVAAVHLLTGTGAIIDERTFAWDAAGNKTRRTDVRTGAPELDHTYSYDSVNRLVRTLVASPTNPSVRDSIYTLDGAGNRLNVTSDPPPGNYTLAATLPEPADAQVNQYSTTPFDSGRQYDANGNVVSVATGAGSETFQYDYRNLIVRTAVGASTPTSYTYDALGRRIQTSVGGVVTRFLSELEEQDAFGNTLGTFVAGRDPAEPFAMRRGSSDFYYHADDRQNVMVLSDGLGNAAERYEYGDYGEPLAPSAVSNPYFFTGRRYDPETGLYYDHARYLDPVVGRFTTRDPLGPWIPTGRDNLGNSYTYSGNNPGRSAEGPAKAGTTNGAEGPGPELEFTLQRVCEPFITLALSGACGTPCVNYAGCQKPAKSCQSHRCGSTK